MKTIRNIELKAGTECLNAAEKVTAAPKNSFEFPPCYFAEVARCRSCGYYSHKDQWCHRHKTWTDPEKWACSEYI